MGRRVICLGSFNFFLLSEERREQDLSHHRWQEDSVGGSRGELGINPSINPSIDGWIGGKMVARKGLCQICTFYVCLRIESERTKYIDKMCIVY